MTAHATTPPRMQASGVATAIDVAVGIVYIVILEDSNAQEHSLTHPPRLVYPFPNTCGQKRYAEGNLPGLTHRR